MNRKKISLLIAMSACFISQPFLSFASSLQDGEKAVAAELKAAIPEEKIKNVDDLYAKWKEMEEGKSDAIIDEFAKSSFCIINRNYLNIVDFPLATDYLS